MSDIAKPKQTAAEYFGKGFLAFPEKLLHELRTLQSALEDLQSDVQVQHNGTTYICPKWGPMGLKLGTTPVFVFDRPELVPILGDTMAADGSNIYIYADFLRRLVKEADTENSYGLLFILCHELGHIMLLHNQRIDVLPEGDYSKRDINIVADIEINIPLYDDYASQYAPGTTFTTFACGLDKQTGRPVDDYRFKSLEELLEAGAHEEVKSQAQKSGDPGEGEPSENPGDMEPGAGGGGADPASDSADMSDDIKSLEDLVKEVAELSKEMGDPSLMDALKRAGILSEKALQELKESTNDGKELPESVINDIQKARDSSASSSHQAVAQSSALSSELGDKMPGAHITDYMVSRIRANEDPQITWLASIAKEIQLIGDKKRMDKKRPMDLSLLRPGDMGLSKRMPWLPKSEKIKDNVNIRALVDTSGSMGEDTELAESVGELIGAAKQLNADIYVYSADTVIRNYPTLITHKKVDDIIRDGAKLFGRGGTDLERSLREVFDRNASEDIANAYDASSAIEDKKAVSSRAGLGGSGVGSSHLGGAGKGEMFDITIYFTDMGDSIPSAAEFSDKERKSTVFIATSNVPNSLVREYRDQGWRAHRIHASEVVNINDEKISSGHSQKNESPAPTP